MNTETSPLLKSIYVQLDGARCDLFELQSSSDSWEAHLARKLLDQFKPEDPSTAFTDLESFFVKTRR